MRSREELAWVAGFFEGEGCISGTRSHGVHVSVVQVDPEPLKRFAAIIGFGEIRVKKQASERWQVCHVWRVTSFEQSQAAIAMLWTWLSARRRNAARRVLAARLASFASPKAFCKNGHPFDELNTATNRNGNRRCRACSRSRNGQWRRENREQVNAMNRRLYAEKKRAA